MERKFLILQTDDYDFQFESDSEKDAEFLMGTLDALMRDNNRGKPPSTFRGMHLSATDEGADRITPDISRGTLWSRNIVASRILAYTAKGF